MSYTVKTMASEHMTQMSQMFATSSTSTSKSAFRSIQSIQSISLQQIGSLKDNFMRSGSDSILRSVVEKMRSAINSPLQNNNLQRFHESNPALSVSIQQINASAFFSVSAENLNDTQKSQLDKNMNQANQVAKQLGTDGSAWGVESLAQDLAVFGLDLTAMNEDPQALTQTIRDKSLELLDNLNKSFSGSESEREAAKRQITGASSRLVHGLSGSGGATAIASSTSVSGKVTVNIDGVEVNAGAIIAVGNVIVDPLVLDLKGDGINLKGHEEGVEFDMNGDGQKTNMGFIQGDDAFLFVDEYGDGMVRDGKQLFGNVDGYANGFEKLASYDDNGDGVIDENDAIWDKLRVWVETTEDGICEANETMSLTDAGITSINVGYQNVREDDGKGNLIGQVGSFTRADGTEGMAADVWLQEGRSQAQSGTPADMDAELETGNRPDAPGTAAAGPQSPDRKPFDPSAFQAFTEFLKQGSWIR
ncbi:MAG: hypothetical protein LUC93_01950 [Planctomycetaceae bacterium]|nr:hypothetical protein [Planctomycetaceae bacterium]